MYSELKENAITCLNRSNGSEIYAAYLRNVGAKDQISTIL